MKQAMLDKLEQTQTTEREILLQIRMIQEELQNLYELTQCLQQRIAQKQPDQPNSELEQLLSFDRDS